MIHKESPSAHAALPRGAPRRPAEAMATLSVEIVEETDPSSGPGASEDSPECEGCGVRLAPKTGYRCAQCPCSFLCEDCVGLKELVHDDVYHVFVRLATNIQPNQPP